MLRNNSKINIVVIDAGWVLVGETVSGDRIVTITNAHVVRVWGTDKGLGQIAMDGPTSKTVTDKIGVAFVERSHIQFMIACEDSKWSLLLK